MPQTISTSYADDEQTGAYACAGALDYRYSFVNLVPIAYAQRVCADFAQLGQLPSLLIPTLPLLTKSTCIGARGVSLLFGSGDGGVGDGQIDPDRTVCFTNDGSNKKTFLPLFPASCP